MKNIFAKTISFLALAVLPGAEKTMAQECRNIAINIAPIRVTKLPLINGDCEMGGNNPHVAGYARVKRQGVYLVVEYEVTLTEDRPDYTTFSKKGEKRIYIPSLESPDCQFGSINYDYGEFEGNAGDDVHYPVTFPGSNLLEKVVVLSDTRGKDCGRLYAHFYFTPITIRLIRR